MGVGFLSLVGMVALRRRWLPSSLAVNRLYMALLLLRIRLPVFRFIFYSKQQTRNLKQREILQISHLGESLRPDGRPHGVRANYHPHHLFDRVPAATHKT